MGKENPKIQHLIEVLFSSGIDILKKENGSEIYNKLFVQLDQETGEIQLYDERERLLRKKIIYDWIGLNQKGVESYQYVLYTLKESLKGLTKRGGFEYPVFSKPFEISLVDNDFKIIEDLFVVEDGFEAEGELMKGLDADLSDFFKKLLLDVE